MTVQRLVQKYELALDVMVLGGLASLMRLWGLSFDLPNLYHRDEARYVSIPLTILKSGDYNPHFFNYPTLFFYLLACAYIVYFLWMASQGRIGNLDGLRLPEQMMPNVVGRATMPSQFLVGRGVVALSGTLTVLLVYWLGRQAYGRRAAWLAALLLCFSPTHIRNSHFVAPDVTMLLLVMGSLCFSYLVLAQGRRRDYLLAGLLAGLATSTKYNAYVVLVPLFVAHFLQRDGKRVINADILLSVLACGVGFFVGTPYALFDLPAFLNGMAFELRHYAIMGDPGSEAQNAWLWYGRYLLRMEGIAPLLAIVEGMRGILAACVPLSGAARVPLCGKWQRKACFFLSFPVVCMLLVSSYAVKNDRTVLTIVPVLAILAGAFLHRIIPIVQSWASDIIRAAMLNWFATVALLAAVLLWPAWKAVQINLRFTQDDVRTQVTRWMEDQLPAGSRIVGEYYSPLLVESKHHFRWVDRAIDQPLAWYLDNADYVVFVENRYGGFYLDAARYHTQIAAYQAMFSQFALVKEFQGGALGNPCRAMIYRVQP